MGPFLGTILGVVGVRGLLVGPVAAEDDQEKPHACENDIAHGTAERHRLAEPGFPRDKASRLHRPAVMDEGGNRASIPVLFWDENHVQAVDGERAP